MDGTDIPNEAPPRISDEPKRRVKGWWIHLMILSLYPVLLGVIGASASQRSQATLLPKEVSALVLVTLLELFIFVVVFGVSWLGSRANRDQLLLRWRNGAQPIWLGLLYSIGLRLGIGLAVAALALAAVVSGLKTSEELSQLRPRTEVVVDTASLTSDPIYFIFAVTIVSFVMGGLREELWRSATLAGMRALFPRALATTSGKLIAVGIVALIFGLGHLPQGWGGAGITAFLGFGLGFIMIRHDSIWEAVFAHGFFNATSFLLLYWLAARFPGALSQ